MGNPFLNTIYCFQQAKTIEIPDIATIKFQEQSVKTKPTHAKPQEPVQTMAPNETLLPQMAVTKPLPLPRYIQDGSRLITSTGKPLLVIVSALIIVYASKSLYSYLK